MVFQMEELKNRTKEQLKQQSRMYLEVYNCLEKHGNIPVMTGGTLLGTVREGDFIVWDWDGEITLLEEHLKNIDAVICELKVSGYRVVPVYEKNKCRFYVYNKDWYIEVFFYYQDKKYYRYGPLKFPKRVIGNFDYLKLRGNFYRVPEDYEGFLTYTYGDWQTVRKERDCKKYLTRERFEDGKLDPMNEEV